MKLQKLLLFSVLVLILISSNSVCDAKLRDRNKDSTPRLRYVNNITFTEENFQELVEGLILGMFHTNVALIDTCFNSTGEMVNTVRSYMSSMSTSTTGGIRFYNTFLMIGSILQYSGLSIYSCAGSEYEIQQMFMVQRSLRNKTVFKDQVIINLQTGGLALLSQVQSSIVYMRAGDFFNFGNVMGQMMRTLFLTADVAKTVSDSDAYDFFNGYFENSNEIIDYQMVYENNAGLGATLYQPISDQLTYLQTLPAIMKQEILDTLYIVGDALLNGVKSLKQTNIVSGTLLARVNRQNNCVQGLNGANITQGMEDYFYFALLDYNGGDPNALGTDFSYIIRSVCP